MANTTLLEPGRCETAIGKRVAASLDMKNPQPAPEPQPTTQTTDSRPGMADAADETRGAIEQPKPLDENIVIDEERKGFWVFVRRRTIVIMAWILLALGVLATIAPTPFGIVVVGLALTMLLTHSPWTKLRFRRYMRRYPQTLAPLLRIPSIKEAIKIRKRRRKARRRARQAAREQRDNLQP